MKQRNQINDNAESHGLQYLLMSISEPRLYTHRKDQTTNIKSGALDKLAINPFPAPGNPSEPSVGRRSTSGAIKSAHVGPW